MVLVTMVAKTKGQATKQEHHRYEGLCYLFFSFCQPTPEMISL
jgi:hypothetical protein